ncbi:hypothetical protein ABTJ52_19575, partial [Acinetobacter baumannii]
LARQISAVGCSAGIRFMDQAVRDLPLSGANRAYRTSGGVLAAATAAALSPRAYRCHLVARMRGDGCASWGHQDLGL